MTIVNCSYILNSPMTVDLPGTEFENFNTVISVADKTTAENFIAAKTYMLRLEPRLQVLFLMLVMRRLPIQNPIKDLPEYAEWYTHPDIKQFLGC